MSNHFSQPHSLSCLLHAQQVWKSTARHPNTPHMPWTCSLVKPHLVTSPPQGAFHAVCLCVPVVERGVCACMCDCEFYLSVFTGVGWELHSLTLYVCVFLSAASSYMSIYSTGVWARSYTNSCVHTYFSEGGNNLIVWVNPKWAELQKQSFSEHLKLENLSDKEGTSSQFFFHSS